MEKDQERQLIEYAKNGDKKSIELLINANKGFLIKIVKYYAAKFPKIDLDKHDMLQAAEMGFIEAIEKFDFNYENNIRTYSKFYVQNKIRGYITKEVEASKALLLDKKISDEEDSANVMVDMVADKRSIDPAEQAMANFQKLDLLEKIKANMNLLTQKEQRLVALKYGFETGKTMSMTEIQEILGCSRENVKKLEARIYRKWKQAGVEEE